MIWLRHGGETYTRHACSLQKKDFVPPVLQTDKTEVKEKSSGGAVNSVGKYTADDDSTEEEEDEYTDEEPDADDSEENASYEEHEDDESGEGSDAETEDDDIKDLEEEEEIDSVVPDQKEEESAEVVPDQNEEESAEVNTGAVKPIRNQYVQYKLKNEENWTWAKILSSQSKKTGKYGNWINVKPDGVEPFCLDWDTVGQWQKLPYPEHFILLTKEEEYSQEVVDAKNKELDKLIENKVYDTVPYTGQKLISSKWHITEKFKDEKRVVKAHLVARGFEEDTTQLRTDSPTCSREAMRMVYFVAAMMSWVIKSLDFTSAFLQGEEIKRSVYLKPPRDVCPKTEVWSLRKCLYGLNDAPRSWYVKVKKALMSLGGVQSLYDGALFLWHGEDGKLVGIVACHVDDFVYCGTNEFQSSVIQKLKVMFKIGEEGSANFRYVGLNVTQTRGEIRVDQNDYVTGIEPIKLSKGRKECVDSQLTSDEKLEIKQLAGQVIWAASQTRPDVAYETCQMANTGKSPTVQMIIEANRAVYKMKKNNVSITFKKLGNPEELEVEVYSDATHASLNDGASSQGAFVIFFKGKNGKTVPLSWRSKRIQRITKSPLASETSALADAADAAYLLASMVKEVFNLRSAPTIHCKTDSKSLVQTLHTSNAVTDHRLKVDIARLRQMTESGEISVSWVRGNMQLSDPLTKHTATTAGLLRAVSA